MGLTNEQLEEIRDMLADHEGDTCDCSLCGQNMQLPPFASLILRALIAEVLECRKRKERP